MNQLEALYYLAFVCYIQNGVLKSLLKNSPELDGSFGIFLQLADSFLQKSLEKVHFENMPLEVQSVLEELLKQENLPEELQQSIRDFLDYLKS